MTARARIPFDDLPIATQAGILCNEPQFQRFAATRSGFPGGQFSSTAAAEYLRSQCKVYSRKDIAGNPDAKSRFAALRTEFDAWTGKIATPR